MISTCNLQFLNSTIALQSFFDSSNINSKVLQKNIENAFSLVFLFNQAVYDPSQAHSKDLDDAIFKLEQIQALFNRYLCSNELTTKEIIIARNAHTIIGAFLNEFMLMKTSLQAYLKENNSSTKNYKAFLYFSSSNFEFFKTSPLFILKLVYFLSLSKINSPSDLDILDKKLKQLTSLLTHKVCYLENMETQLHQLESFSADLETLIQLRFETILSGLDGLGGISCMFNPLQEFLNQMIWTKMDNSIPSLELLEFSQPFSDFQEKWKSAKKLNLQDPNLDQSQTSLFMRQFVQSYQKFISKVCLMPLNHHFY